MNKKEKILEVLDKVRPFLQNDGGDVEFVSFDNGIVKIKMLGACMNCTLLDNTLYDGIEAILQDEVEGVIGVELVE